MTLSIEYIAGFFDGEGTIFMNNAGALEVRITQCDLRPLQAIRDTLGYGTIAPISVGSNSAPCSQWRVCNWEEGLGFLQTVLPFLIVKRDEAKIILTYAEARSSLGIPCGRHLKRHTPETIQLRDETKHRLRTFKKGRSRVPVLSPSHAS